MEWKKRFKQAIVIDNGTYSIKAGVSGQEQPLCIIRNLVGDFIHKAIPGTEHFDKHSVIGDGIKNENRSVLKLRRPMERGQVTDWDMMSEVWNHIFFEKLKDEIKPDEEAVLITESILNPKGNREKAAEILFETFNIPAI